MHKLNISSFRPGFLVRPLGWVNERLADLLISHPELLKVLFVLDAFRMHSLALGLAHYADKPSPALVRALASDSPQPALGLIIRCWPRGLDRALRVLPNDAVLSCKSYRRLIVLLKDQPTASYLHHCNSITSPMLAGLIALPKPLRRPAIYKLFDEVEGMDRFIVGLKFLSCRAGIEFDILVAELGALDQTAQVVGKIADLAENLPLPDRLPDREIGSFVRLDNVTEIRSLAKDWRNCLGDCLHDINEGTNLLYISTEDRPLAAALVVRANRLGWALAQIKGPKNVDLDRHSVARHHNTFANAGIPRSTNLAAIKGLLWRRQFPRRLRF